MKETEEIYLFWRHQFGQWTLRDMVDTDGIRYNCCEQYMMAKKAGLFGDKASYKEIMQTPEPQTQQKLGRAVRGYNQQIWDNNKVCIVWSANYLKFSQHDDLKQRLLATGEKLLAEASPTDLIWGIGFDENAPEALTPERWRGRNLLGEVLMSVRAALHLA